MSNQIFIINDFFPRAAELWGAFEENFRHPFLYSSKRFVWDYWHVRSWFTYFRTPAAQYFPPEMYRDFRRHLMVWSEHTLGVKHYRPLWLSYYINGCYQGLHRDTANGPWSFVYCLSPEETRRFVGGETLLAEPALTDYWQSRAFEPAVKIFETIRPTFNQLIVFDSRLLHGVTMVDGTMDPLEGRIVIHGWLVANGLLIKGALAKEIAGQVINQALLGLNVSLKQFQEVNGLITARLCVSENGEVTSVEILSNTLMPTSSSRVAPEEMLQVINQSLEVVRFPSAGGRTWVTIPIQIPIIEE
jgi:hypothetical protein